MTYPNTIIRYGEPEVVYVHITAMKGDRWYCTMSRLHPSNMRILGMCYDCDKSCPFDVNRVLKLYTKFLEDFFSL